MKKYGYLLLPILILLLCGCQVQREYLWVKPHEEQYVQQENADAIVISDYDGLVSTLLQQCGRRDTSGLIRVYGYPGEIVEDVPKAVYYVAKQSAIGTYAVDYITYDCTQVVSYYEISVDITYTKTLEEMQALIALRGKNPVEERISNALESYASDLALRIYANEIFDAEAYVQQYYEDNPGKVQACPQVEVKHYPEQVDSEYILEMQFTYPHSDELLQQYQAEVNAVVDAAVEYVQYREEEEEKLQLLYVYLSERFEYLEESTDTPVYSVLCEGKADPLAFARTMKTLCEASGLECWVVRGSYNDEPWVWNIVKVDGQYYHADPMRSLSAGQTALSLELDSTMALYSWPQSEYPACTLQPNGGIDMREDADSPSGEFSENVRPNP